MEPARECCILQSQTQVIVTPKYREVSQSVAAKSVKHQFASVRGDLETHGDTSSSDMRDTSAVALTPVNRLLGGFWKFLFGSETDDNIAESVTYKTEAWNIKAKLFCRVLALEDFAVDKLKRNSTVNRQRILDADNEFGSDFTLGETVSCSDLSFDSADLLKQPTNVYISIFTILSQIPAVSLDSVPDTFLATLSRLRSPSEQLADNRIQRSKSAHSSSEDLTENDSVADERKIVVRVIVTNINSESRTSGFRFMQPVPKKHILLSSLLRRQMNISGVTGQVALTPLCISSDMCPAKIKVFPLFATVSCT